MVGAISRRRFIRISGVAAGLALGAPVRAATSEANLAVWRGIMLGAVATMKIYHHNRGEAERLISAAYSEARRLERLFSLYLEDSDLVRLNRTGILVGPPAELVELLKASLRFAELTGGMFDPTVQPLWDLYANHFAQEGADPSGPDKVSVKAALACVGYHRLSVSSERVVVPKGTAITLNGIAQGYITDKIVELLRSRGVAHTLVDMGETRAIGARADGEAWEIGIADPEFPGRTQARLPIVDRAVSTSGAYGFRFDSAGRFNHLFDPRTGACGHLYRSVTTIAETATATDALSTAFSLMDQKRIRALLSRAGLERVHLIDATGAMANLVV
ncbi:FAD:protein FMN transferase [Bradyrhizobium sp. CB1650]|uniref:FAD:protein FMN transferase n=1 Tax=Bradyrhizobium sp. CB1650 TaxID=3039153 RepID=UPI002434D34C|nr:FAD:protein FMN transferase [Bradyrhizobium sp. CB1650]WGD55029.1 FAD:protein FMN transferase [Bradyrhizobium sp. CB1650]